MNLVINNIISLYIIGPGRQAPGFFNEPQTYGEQRT